MKNLVRKAGALTLTATMLLASVGCGDKKSDSGSVEMSLPAGAPTAYDLYEQVYDVVTTGGSVSDLEDVFDPALSALFSSLIAYSYNGEECIALLQDKTLDEAYETVATLYGYIIDELPSDSDDFDDDDIDYDDLYDQLSDADQKLTDADDPAFCKWCRQLTMMAYYHKYDEDGMLEDMALEDSDYNRDMMIMSGDEFNRYVQPFDDYDDAYPELEELFPGVYTIEIGGYEDDGYYVSVAYLYFEYNGAYYLLMFSRTM